MQPNSSPLPSIIMSHKTTICVPWYSASDLPHQVKVELSGFTKALALHDTGNHAVTDSTEVSDGRKVIEDDGSRDQAFVFHTTELNTQLVYYPDRKNFDKERGETYTSSTKVSHTNTLLNLVVAVHNQRVDVLRRVEDGAAPVEVVQLLHERMARVEDDALPFTPVARQSFGSDRAQLLEEDVDIFGVKWLLRLGQGHELSRRGQPARVGHWQDRVGDRHVECF